LVYPYSCEKCDIEFDVVKHHSKSSKKEKCPQCKSTATRIWPMPLFIGTAVQNAEFNPGLGVVTKSKRHREELCKRMDLVEVGNEKPKTFRKHFEQERETKRRKAYED